LEQTNTGADAGGTVYFRCVASIPSFLIADLLQGYRSGSFGVRDVIECAIERADQASQHHVWITRLSRPQALSYADALEGRSIDELPLYGIPFVIKDNIDLEGIATTAACREYSYVPAQSAVVVQRLLDAGAIPLGKTNLDQFATGLVGTRSPFGACRNSFDARYISGGSSSGSAVAVATGLASFALGTDTAGSGRIPAGFNNIVGLKPSLGRLSTRGVVPACRSLDCVSILSLTCEDAARVLNVAEGFDPEDTFSRPIEQVAIGGLRCGVPHADQLQFFGDLEYARLFDSAAGRIESLGGSVVNIDAAPLFEAARLLYEGPWIAERYAALTPFMQANADAMHPVTRDIIRGGASPSAVDAFTAQYRLMALKRAAEQVWDAVDVILMPTAPTIFEISQVDADPIRLNSALGYYTNFVNLMDLAAVAVPAGFRHDGLPFGVTLIARRSTDRALLQLADRLHRCCAEGLGATPWKMPPPAGNSSAPDALPARDPLPGLDAGFMRLAVCGAHMQGLALNQQLLERGGYLLRRTRTAAHYRLYALSGPPPQRPGLVRTSKGGASIEVEVWAMRSADFGSFVAGIPAPLGIGTIELQNGEKVPGFLCESYAAADAADITALGGWRAYLSAGIDAGGLQDVPQLG
jgi:allophanate hydrolase